MFNTWITERWWARAITVSLTYIVAANVLPVLLLLAINCSGYLPYSDRPGTGWQPPHFPSREELGFFLGFSLLLLRASAIYGLIFAVVSLVLEFLSLPKWIIRLLIAVPAFLASGLVMAAVGWFIAISAVGVWIAAICGLLWALLLLPILVSPRGIGLPLWLRVTVAASLAGTSVFFLLKPFLPNPAETTATVLVLEEHSQGKPMKELDWSKFGGMPAMKAIPQGRFLPVSLSTYDMSEKRKSRVLIILRDHAGAEYTLTVPRTGDAVYVEQAGNWIDLLKAEKKATFGLKVSNGEVMGVEGTCCHSGSSENYPLPNPH